MTDVTDLDAIWRALADPTRRALLDLLRERPRTTGELTAIFEPSLSRFAVMKHLGVLESANLVTVRRNGRRVWHYLNAIPLQHMYERWVRPYEAHWASSLLRLQQHAERIGSLQEEMMQTFQIEQEVIIAASPARVYRALTDGIDNWWRMRTVEGSLRLEPRAGGRFYEEAEGKATLWATITRVEQDRVLEMHGQMGMTGAVLNLICYTLTARDVSTVLALSHQAIGAVTDETREGYARGWDMLLAQALKSYVESLEYGAAAGA